MGNPSIINSKEQFFNIIYDGNGVGNFKYSVPSGFLANCTKNVGS